MSTGLESVQAFFNLKSQTAGIENAMGIANPFLTFVIWATQVIGFFAIAIWMLRIAVDIICLTTKNLSFAEGIAKFGTGKEGSYDSVKAYISGNGLEIISVVILTVLMMTGMLYRILSLALGGVGTVLNFIFDLDLDGINSATDAASYKEQLSARRNTNMRNEYDQRLTEVRGFADQLYQMAQEGTKPSNPTFQKVKRNYTTALAKAELLSDAIGTTGADELKVGQQYFEQHKYDKNVCNTEFLDNDTVNIWDTNIKCN